MLVLTRRVGETLRIAGDIKVTVIRLKNGAVALGVTAPDAVTILREELYQKICAQRNIVID